MSSGPTSVSAMFDLADLFKQAIEAAMTSTTAGAPQRAYVYPDASPEFYTECSQAVVCIPALTEEQTSPVAPVAVTGRRFHFGRMNLVTLNGYAIRCVAVSEGNQQQFRPLSDATLNTQSRIMYEDGWALWETMTELLKPPESIMGGICSDVHFDLGRPVRPLGGLAGWSMTLRAWLQGYVPDLVWPPS